MLAVVAAEVRAVVDLVVLVVVEQEAIILIMERMALQT
jgi:hypothetical protein